MEYEAIEQGSGDAKVKATLWTGDSPGGTNLVLGDCGDTIEVNGTTLSHVEGDPDYYQADVSKTGTYEFVFIREEEDPYSSTVSCRNEVNITAPDGESISREDSFEITWANNDSGEIELLIEGSCFWDYPGPGGEDISDNGSHSVNGGEIEAHDSDAGENCTADITLTRNNPGDLNSSLKGTIVGKSVGTSSFMSTP